MADETDPRTSPHFSSSDSDAGRVEGPDPSSAFLPADRFVLQRRLGKGGFGTVDAAYDRQRQMHVALKTLHRLDLGSIFEFKKEFRTLADLSHPNLVAFHDLIGDGEHWCIVMELVRGTDFLSYVKSDPHTTDGNITDLTITTPAHMACDIDRLGSAMSQLVNALVYLHGHGKLHRDIKPSNVLVTPEGTVKLLDFGLTTDVVRDPDDTMPLRGTPAYISPEQAAGGRATEASDWYSVGVMLYEALTGHRPFSGSYAQVLAAKQQLHAPAPASMCEGVPAPLDALCRDLLERAPERRPSDAEVLSRVERIWPTSAAFPLRVPARTKTRIFVGRGQHLEVLHRAFDDSLAGRPQFVHVYGASGLGKTALVRRFLEEAREGCPETVILEGRCYERESVPYKALDSLVDRLSRYLRRLPISQAEALLPRDVSALTRLFPILGRVDAVAQLRQRPIELSNAQELRRRGFAAFGEMLARLANRHPVIVAIDDLQWGDTDSASLLASLIFGSDPPPVLFVACYRLEEARASAALQKVLFSPEPLPRGVGVHRLPVEQLSMREARELAGALSEHHGDAALVESIARESGGSPFFVNELVQYSGALTRPQLASSDAGPTLPEISLESLIAARIERLGEGPRRLLDVVTVHGRPLRLTMAAGVAGLDGGGLEEATLLRSAHLARSRIGRDGEELDLYHDRIRDAVAAHIPATLRRQWHERLAKALERAGQGDPETLVVHYRGAGQPRPAARHAVIAGDRACDALAFDRAAALYRLALELGEFDAARRREIHRKLGDVLAANGRGHDAAEAYLSASEGALAAELLELKRRAAEQLLRSGHIDEGLRTIGDVLASLGMTMPSSPMRALLSLLAGRAQIRLRGLSFRERDRSELSAAELVRVDACWSVATAIGVVDTVRGAAFQARHVLLALESGDPHRIARALAVEIAYAALQGARTHERQEELTRLAQDLAERVGRPETIALVTLARGTAAYFQGNWTVAHELLSEVEPMLRECSGVAWELDTAHLYDLLAMFYLGRVKELSARIPALLAQAHERDDLTAATNLRSRIAYVVHLAADDPARAREDISQAMASWGRSGFHAQHSWELYTLGEVDLYSGNGTAAWKRIDDCWRPLRRSLLMGIQNVRIESRYLRARSAIAAAIQTANKASWIRAALATARRDAARLDNEGAAWAAALSNLIAAGLATLDDDRDSATECLESAETGFRAQSMDLHAVVASRRRGELLAGVTGDGIVRDADAWMSSQGIRSPMRMADMFAPGAFSTRTR